MALSSERMEPEYLMAASVARILGVSTATIRYWAAQGMLPCHKTAGGHRRFALTEVLEFAARHGLEASVDASPNFRILVVDDDLEFANAISALLAEVNPRFQICISSDGFDAGFGVRDFRPDVVLLDLHMPGLDGYSVCERIQRDPDTRSICVIAMTGGKTASVEARVKSVGAAACLAKPLRLDELHGILKEYFQGRPQAALIGLPFTKLA